MRKYKMILNGRLTSLWEACVQLILCCAVGFAPQYIEKINENNRTEKYFYKLRFEILCYKEMRQIMKVE